MFVQFLPMKGKTRIAAALLSLSGLLMPLGPAPASAANRRPALTKREMSIHVLNRLAFGPRPGEVDEVMSEGVEVWIERQLHPERISDDVLDARLKQLPTLWMASDELFDQYERPLRNAVRKQKQKGGLLDLRSVREEVPPQKRPRRIIEELSASRVLRAVYSRRQLNEVLVDFWMNHFNVFAGKRLDRVFIASFERDAIRPHIWGRFEDLLMATAKSPAMLFYLDNARSTSESSRRKFGRSAGSGGLNENYARELLELHTLGVDGGYTQTDVTELARVFTGWSIDRRSENPGGFLFRPRVHDERAKTVLGYRFLADGGIEEGERIIHLLAHHPSTARHIAFELAQRLVADEPPPELVDRAAGEFLATGGDLRRTVRVIVESPEFFDPTYFQTGVKSPFTYAVSAVRAVAADTNGALPIARSIAQMGEPLYLCQPPTGFPNVGSAWMNTGALLARFNFSLSLAANRIPGTQVHLDRLLSPQAAADGKKAVETLGRAMTGGDLSLETRKAIESHLQSRTDGTDDPAARSQLPLIAGLILGSPEFQRQ